MRPPTEDAARRSSRTTFAAVVLLGAGALGLALRSPLAVAFAPARTAAPAPAASAADRWPQFRGNPALTGEAAGKLPDTLKVLWTVEAGESIESSAAIADGTVYVGVHPGDLLAVDLEKGTVRWKYPIPGDGIGESSPAVADGIVYVGDLGGTVHAVDAASGKGLWTYKTGKEIKSSPVVTEGKVLIGSYDGHLYAFDQKSGKLAWKLETEGPVHATAASSTASAT